MDPIPSINISNIQSANIYRIPSHDLYINPIPNVHPPVTLDIGFPIVHLPGCVWKHQDDRRSYSSVDPWDKNLVENDSDGAGVLCPSGSMPHFYPINFNPENRLPTIIAKRGEPPPPPPGAETPKDPVKEKEEVPCPGPNQPRIGDVAQNQKEKVVGYELQPDPNDERVEICVILYEDIPIVEQYLPAPQVVATTGGIAAVAATSALLAKPLADLLLRVVKPAVKQAIGKIQRALGKTPYRPTPSEVRTNEYRKKKGLVGINFAKRAKPLKKVEEKEKKT
jgi:hypothetical protein